MSKIRVFPLRGHNKADMTVEEQLRVCNDEVAALGQFDRSYYNDGSVKQSVQGWTMGAASVISVVNSVATVISHVPGCGFLVDPCAVELRGIAHAFSLCLVDTRLHPLCKKILIVSDSQSGLELIASGPFVKDPLSSQLWSDMICWCRNDPDRRIVFQHVFSHCGVEFNELADVEADNALSSLSTVQQSEVPISFPGIQQHLKAHSRRERFANLDRTTARFKMFKSISFPLKPLSGPVSRFHETLLCQLRTGSVSFLGPFHIALNGRVGPDQRCRWCRHARAIESVPHLFKCSDRRVVRLRKQFNCQKASVLSDYTKVVDITNFLRALLHLVGQVVPSTWPVEGRPLNIYPP